MINGANVGGADLSIVIGNRERDMACFDVMPPALRKALREGITDYAVAPLAERIVRSPFPSYEAAGICSEITSHGNAIFAAHSRRIDMALAR